MRTLLLLLCVLSAGCATVLSGTRQDLSFTSEPASTTVVLGGAPAEILAKVKDVSDAKDFVVRLLGSALPDDARRFLEALTPDELLTMLVAVLHPTAATVTTVDTLGTLYARTPQLVRDVVTKTIFVAGAGTTPFGLNLKKGSEYAAISWAPGRRAKLLVVETRFNFVSLLNIFTLGLGFVVDALTGAWFSLHPSELSWQLSPHVDGMPQ
ncbi:MAG: hypothetical protein ABTQ32_31605 [Myxococcaceae bacterium]